MATLIAFLSCLGSQEITKFRGLFGNKYYQDEDRISRREFNTLMLNDPKADELNLATRDATMFAALSGVAHFGAVIWVSTNTAQEGKAIPTAMLLSSLAGVIVFSIRARNKKRKTILRYNQSLEEKDMGLEIKIGFNEYGLGVVYPFK